MYLPEYFLIWIFKGFTDTVYFQTWHRLIPLLLYIFYLYIFILVVVNSCCSGQVILMNAENSVCIDMGYIQRQELYEENIVKIF